MNQKFKVSLRLSHLNLICSTWRALPPPPLLEPPANISITFLPQRSRTNYSSQENLAGARAKKKRDYLDKIFQKEPKNGILTFFSNICLHHRNFCQNSVFMMFKECSANQFDRTEKKGRPNCLKVYENRPFLEKLLEPPLSKVLKLIKKANKTKDILSNIEPALFKFPYKNPNMPDCCKSDTLLCDNFFGPQNTF